MSDKNLQDDEKAPPAPPSAPAQPAPLSVDYLDLYKYETFYEHVTNHRPPPPPPGGEED